MPPHDPSKTATPLRFSCALCAKSYARINDYEAHLSSYDHTHRARLRDMKLMSRDPTAADRARKAEAKANQRDGLGGLITIKAFGGGGGGAAGGKEGAGDGGKKAGGFKKGGFKSAFGGAGPAAVAASVADGDGGKAAVAETVDAHVRVSNAASASDDDDSDEHDLGYEYYNPARPTGCDGRCSGA